MVILKFVSGGVEGRFVVAPWFNWIAGAPDLERLARPQISRRRLLSRGLRMRLLVPFMTAVHDSKAHMEAARCARRVVMRRSQCDFQKVYVE